jgi:DNA-binding transcriptional MerR regulator
MPRFRAVKNKRPYKLRPRRALPPPEGLSRTEIAARAGISAHTVRDYQNAGLFPRLPFHGRRTRYGREHLARLVAIVTLRRSGLHLDAIRARLAALTSEEIDAYLPPATPAPDEAQPSIATTIAPLALVSTTSPWHRVALLPGVELHVRADVSVAARKITEELIAQFVVSESGSPNFEVNR